MRTAFFSKTRHFNWFGNNEICANSSYMVFTTVEKYCYACCYPECSIEPIYQSFDSVVNDIVLEERRMGEENFENHLNSDCNFDHNLFQRIFMFCPTKGNSHGVKGRRMCGTDVWWPQLAYFRTIFIRVLCWAKTSVEINSKYNECTTNTDVIKQIEIGFGDILLFLAIPETFLSTTGYAEK